MSDMQDKIFINDLMVKAIVGIYPQERVNKQEIIIDLVMSVDTAKAQISDNMSDTVDYGLVAKSIIKYTENKKPLLLESLAHDLIKLCFNLDEKIEAIEISLQKPQAFDFCSGVGVKLYRTRKQMKNILRQK